MKKLTLVTVGLLTAVLVGCGSTTTTTTAPKSNSSTTTSTATTNTASTSTNGGQSTQSAALKTQEVNLTVLPGGRLGPDGKMHDTYTDPNFTVVEGVPVKLSVYNYDSGTHTISNADLNLNLAVKGSTKKGVPAVSTVTFTPTKTGDFNWQCLDKCDGGMTSYSMTHKGYMEGTIHVVPFNNVQYEYVAIKDGLQFASADGKMHDSYSPADLNVQAGIPVKVTVENFDTGSHSMSSPQLGLNAMIKGATKEGVPSVTTFTFTPSKAGKFHWSCMVPCDGNGWAMTHDGYMAGNINVVS